MGSMTTCLCGAIAKHCTHMAPGGSLETSVCCGHNNRNVPLMFTPQIMTSRCPRCRCTPSGTILQQILAVALETIGSHMDAWFSTWMTKPATPAAKLTQ